MTPFSLRRLNIKAVQFCDGPAFECCEGSASESPNSVRSGSNELACDGPASDASPCEIFSGLSVTYDERNSSSENIWSLKGSFPAAQNPLHIFFGVNAYKNASPTRLPTS